LTQPRNSVLCGIYGRRTLLCWLNVHQNWLRQTWFPLLSCCRPELAD